MKTNKKLHLVYGYYKGIMFLTKAPSLTALSMKRYIRGKYNLKAKKEWQNRTA